MAQRKIEGAVVDITEQWGKVVKNRVSRKMQGASKEDKQDYEQECYVKLIELRDVIERIHSDQGLQEATRFVYKVLNDLIIDLKRYDRIRKHQNLDDPTIQEQPPENSKKAELDEAISHLSEVEQYVVRGLFYLGMTEKELAKATGKSRDWVARIKAKAVNELRDLLNAS